MGGYKLINFKHLLHSPVLFVSLFLSVFAACSKDANDDLQRLSLSAQSADSTAADTAGQPLIVIDTTWADTLRINWDTLTTLTPDTLTPDTLTPDTLTLDSTRLDSNTEHGTGKAGEAASRGGEKEMLNPDYERDK